MNKKLSIFLGKFSYILDIILYTNNNKTRHPTIYHSKNIYPYKNSEHEV